MSSNFYKRFLSDTSFLLSLIRLIVCGWKLLLFMFCVGVLLIRAMVIRYRLI